MPTPPPLPPDRPDLAERYGVGARRWQTVVPLALVGLVLVGLLVATGWGLAQRQTGVRAGVVSYGDIEPGSITITLEVVRPPDQAVVCDVAAIGDNQVDVGAARVEIPPGEPRVVVSTPIPTASPPKAARLLGCSPAG